MYLFKKVGIFFIENSNSIITLIIVIIMNYDNAEKITPSVTAAN